MQCAIGVKHKVASREAVSFEGQGHLGSCIARGGSCVLRDRLEGLSKLGGAHRLGGKLMTQFQTKVPHPLTDHLPGFLPARGVTTPAVGVLLLVFIGKSRGVSPTMQIERDDIGGSERLLRQVREEQLVDDALSGEADATLLLGSWMGRHYNAKAEPCWSHRHVRAVVERAHQPTFRVCELLIGGKLEASLHLGEAFAPDSLCPASPTRSLPGKL